MAASTFLPASVIVTSPSLAEQIGRPEPSPLRGPKLEYTTGPEIIAYSPAPNPATPPVLGYLLFSVPATFIFFLLVPYIQHLALRFRLLD
jgi:hypothetical protein